MKKQYTSNLGCANAASVNMSGPAGCSCLSHVLSVRIENGKALSSGMARQCGDRLGTAGQGADRPG